MDMRIDVIAVPHASLRNPNPEKPGEVHQLQKKNAEQTNDKVTTCVQKAKNVATEGNNEVDSLCST